MLYFICKYICSRWYFAYIFLLFWMDNTTVSVSLSFSVWWTYFSSVTICLSAFRAWSRPWFCSSSLSIATLCCFFCCSSSRSAICRAFTLLHSLHTSKEKHISTLTGKCADNANSGTTYFSSSILRSCSLFSKQLCLSFSSPNRDVAWAFRASRSLASCKNIKGLHCMWIFL